jgi:hypothetical protein
MFFNYTNIRKGARGYYVEKLIFMCLKAQCGFAGDACDASLYKK